MLFRAERHSHSWVAIPMDASAREPEEYWHSCSLHVTPSRNASGEGSEKHRGVKPADSFVGAAFVSCAEKQGVCVPRSPNLFQTYP